MKKISLLLVVLLAAGSAGLYGQMAIGTEFKISGEATATLGYNLDEPTQLGFKNEASANITLELVAEQSADNEGMVGMSGWVGSIELKDFKIIINSDDEDGQEFHVADGDDDSDAPDLKRTGLLVTEPTIVAKLKNGPLFVQIFDAPGNEAGLIDAVENDEDEDNDAESDDQQNDVATDLGGAGVTLGYSTDDLGVSLGVTSDEAYDSDSEGGWTISADVDVNVGAADIQLQIVQGLPHKNHSNDAVDDEGNPDLAARAKDDTGVAAKLKTVVGDITLSAGADIVLTGADDVAGTDDDESLNFEIGIGADVALTENTKFSSAFIYSSVQSVGSDLEVVLTDKSGLVDRLDLSLIWGLFDIANGAAGGAPDANDKMDMFLQADVGYGMDALGGVLTPGSKVTINQTDDGDAVVGLELRAILTEAIPAAEIGLKWATGALFDGTNPDGTAKAAETGTVTAWTKIKY